MARILLIDDEEIVRTAIGAAVCFFGHDVVEARDGEEGVSHFQHQSFDLVITDMQMPGMQGTAVIHAIRNLLPQIPIIAFGGGGTIMAAPADQMARQLGADRVLFKPIAAQELKAALSELLPGAGAP